MDKYCISEYNEEMSNRIEHARRTTGGLSSLILTENISAD
jgi:hypothetical protein